MNSLPVSPLSPEERNRIAVQMYSLMEKQVRSYHKHNHMGIHSSVPVELAQELMASLEYTLSLAGGLRANGSLEEALSLGQEILKTNEKKARAILDLVSVTAPTWQTECRWEALRCLRQYLDRYDPIHLAQRGPEDLFYPTPLSPPEGLQGMDLCLFHLNLLWVENRILEAFPPETLEPFWDRLPADTLNQCEPLVINALGKILTGSGIESLLFSPTERTQLAATLQNATEETLRNAAGALCRKLALEDENARAYIEALVPQLTHWLGPNTAPEALDLLFL